MTIKRLPFLLLAIIIVSILVVFGSTNIAHASTAVYATVETTPVLSPPDAADDSAIWIHPTDTSLSTIIGTDKPGGLEVYDLSGNVLQRIPFKTNNVDIRYNFPLGGERVALVTGIDRTAHKMFAYKVNTSTRLLEDVSTPTPGIIGLYGSAMYVSPIDKKYYAFTNLDSVLKQYELYDNGTGKVAVNLVRTVTFGSFINLTEGVVSDDVTGKVYVSEEAVAIWELGAEPGDGDTKVMVDKPISQGGHFQPDIEGLTIYYKSDGTGYLIGSSQGNGTYIVYKRESPHDYIGTFNIAESVTDLVSGTDGIDVTNFPLGSNFPYGVFIAQDGVNKDGAVTLNQNFKLVPFDNIATALGLTMDTTWDPRLVGSGPLPPPPNNLYFSPTDDAHVNSGNANKNFGSVATLQTLSPTKNFFLKFNLSGINESQILGAKLRLYNTDASNLGGDLMFVPDNSWTEMTVKWNNAPVVSGGIVSSLGSVVKNNWYEFNVIPVVIGDGIYSFRVNTPSTNSAAYYSKEGTAGFRPQLVITLP